MHHIFIKNKIGKFDKKCLQKVSFLTFSKSFSQLRDVISLSIANLRLVVEIAGKS